MKVNQVQKTQTQVLKLLYNAKGQTLSGVQISEQTGISRVAVWKHIKALKALRIPISSSPKGYALADPDNLLEPFCFPLELQEQIYHFQEVETTMDTAKLLARDGAPHMSCCVAEHQTKGRGRLNREWVSDRGGLWFTLILKPDIPPPMAYIYNFAASLSLSCVINTLYNLETRVKWPNDLLLEGKKITGLLSEMETRADMIQFLVIGIGTNVNNDPANDSFDATSIQNTLGKPVSRRNLLSEFLLDFKNRTTEMDIPKIMAQWREQTTTIGSRVRVETLGKTLSGTATHVDDLGTLFIETRDGKTEKIIYGDCFHT